MTEDGNAFGHDVVALSEYIAALGEPYKPYAQNILTKGLFGEYLLDRVGSMDQFAEALSKVGCTTESHVSKVDFSTTHTSMHPPLCLLTHPSIYPPTYPKTDLATF